MKCFGFKKSAIDWFDSYLKDRSYFVDIEKTYSEPGIIGCRVPQGSILGPFFFFIYVNDLPQALKKCKVRLYADDT